MRVLYVQYTNPGAYPPLVRGAELVAERGGEVRMLGTRVRGLEALDVQPVPGISVQLADAASDGWRLKTHYARYAAWVAREAVAWRPDWIYASDLLSAPVALALARLTDARIAYHEHDAPVHDRPSWFVQRCLHARDRLLHSADLVIAPNAARARRLSTLVGGRDVLTVWNCPRRPVGRPARADAPAGFRILFRGSVNANRLPLAVVDALATLGEDASLSIAGYETAGSRGYLQRIADHARTLGIADRVRHLGTVPERDLASVCRTMHIGLALMPMASGDENMTNMTGASNKVFEYLAYGIVPLVSDLEDWRETFVRPGYALACDPRDAASIAAALGSARSERPAMQAIAERGWQRLQDDWNYETQFAPVLEAMGVPGGYFAAPNVRPPHGEVVCAS